MSRDQLIEVYLDFLNNYLTYSHYAECHGLTEDQAVALLAIGRQCWQTPHPEA